MSNKTLYSLWGSLYIICAALGFIPDPPALARWVFTGLSLLFFLPPAVLLYRARKNQDGFTRSLIRNLCFASLGLTLLLLVLNVVCAMGSTFWGNVLHGLLVVLSCPMVCSGYWVLSLFLWACLLMGSLKAK